MIKKVLSKYKEMPLVGKAMIWFVICTLFQKCIAFITVPIFTRLMPTSEYGLYSTYLSWYSIVVIFCSLNMQNCVYSNILAKNKNKDEKNSAAISMLSLAGLITIILFIIYLIFQPFFNKIFGLPSIFIYMIFIQALFEPAINFWLTNKQFEYDYKSMIKKTVLFSLSNITLGILFVVLSSDNQALAKIISGVLVNVILGGYFYFYFYKLSKKWFYIKNWKKYLQVQLPLLPHSLSLMLLSSADRIMINNIVGSVEAAIYSVAYSAGILINTLKNSIIDAMKPWMYKKIEEKQYETINNIAKSFSFFIMLFTFFFIALAPEVVKILAPGEYYGAIYIIPPVAASSFFTFLYNMFSYISFYYEKTNKIMIASVSSALLNIILNFIFINKYGYLAAGYTTLICYIFLAFVHFILMKSVAKKNLGNVKIFDGKYFLILGIAVVIAAITFSVIYKYLIIRILIIIILFLILLKNKNKIMNLIRKIKKKETIQ